ncbi:amino acid ABC transporter permease [Pseudodesulfovibrio tunisiensis]|uniref:amino acid ABC transporter permease n=1 Tax=Pseudodesulfovibrio tunisiensis TaxID=463192 RepID=UPI001FB50F49|nr:amino acid ABC transporter permease [Pseudodesulfovibrio tunisiensis]
METTNAMNEPKVFSPLPQLPPPPSSIGVAGWLKANLFNGWFNSILTLCSVGLLLKVVPPLVSWALLDACWIGEPGQCDQTGGACWAFVFHKMRLLLTGTYPSEFVWRPSIAGILFVLMAAATVSGKVKARYLVPGWGLLTVLSFWLIGGGAGLAHVDQSMWGGLMLSLGLAAIGILISVPLGILLALGRQSSLGMIRPLCIAIIEPIRGVPLITILFMASVMMPLFLPPGMQVNNLLRVQVGIILFSSAYMAEVVRGGLQAVPKGQLDAAKALGLSYWKLTLLVVLPQALRHVLPALIGRCIALFKDTSLVIIVGLLDFLGIAKAAAQDQDWLGCDAEAYVFCAFVYWCICFGMSRYGRSLEKRGPKTNK